MKKNSSIFAMIFWAAILSAQAPPWSVTPANYSNSMTFTIQIQLDGNEVNSGNNLLAAVVGGDIRGVANPSNIGGQHYYFLTAYSNVPSGEELSFQVWLENENDVFTAVEKVDFVKNGNMGGYPDGFDLHFSLDGDFPISLAAMPHDTTLATYAFDDIALMDFLVSMDNDPVDWSVTHGTNVTGSISGDTLTVTANDPNWTGTDSVEITATETGTPNNYQASQFVRFTTETNYAAPVFGSIPTQTIENNQPAPSGDLNTYLTYTGPCLEYAFQLTLPTGSEPVPSWSQPAGNPGAMTLVAQANFGGQTVAGSSNLLAGFINGQLVGVAQQQQIGDKEIFYLTLANIESGNITLKFYDANNQYVHERESGLTFVPNASEGNFNSPFQMDFAPFSIDLLSTGAWSSALLDTNWTGSQEVFFYVEDCSYPDKDDEVSVIFSTGNCSVQNVVWSGAGDGINWSDPANWDGGFLPQGCHHIVIPNGQNVTVEAGFSAFGKTLEVETGATLETSPAAVMDVGN